MALNTVSGGKLELLALCGQRFLLWYDRTSAALVRTAEKTTRRQSFLEDQLLRVTPHHS